MYKQMLSCRALEKYLRTMSKALGSAGIIQLGIVSVQLFQT